VLERARDVINDPATPEMKVYKIGANVVRAEIEATATHASKEP
jgi:hypothetical protein